MKIPSASSFTRPRRALLAAGGSLAFLLLPFILFHPEKKPVVPPHASRRNIEYLPAGSESADPGLQYMLQRHDPRLFLFPGENRGFAIFRVRPDFLEPDISSEHRAELLFPAHSSVSPRPAMTPGPLPRSETAFSASLFIPSPRIAPASTDASVEPGKLEKFVPVIRAASGEVLPDSRITAFSESEIRAFHPRGPTRLLVELPALPDLPGHAGILASCGVPRLDVEACRRLNLILQGSALPKLSRGQDVFSVYWLAPAVSPAFSAGLQEENEEGPES